MKKIAVGLLAGLGALSVAGSANIPEQDSRNKRNISNHEVAYVQPSVDSFVGHLDLLVTRNYDGRVGLVEASPTEVVYTDERSGEVLRTEEGPLRLKPNRGYNGHFIGSEPLVNFLIGDGLEGATEGERSYFHTVLELNMSDSRWRSSYMVIHKSNEVFSGQYSDITVLHRPDNRGEARLIDQGRDGIVDFLVLDVYSGEDKIVDLNELENIELQRQVSFEKDRMLERTERNHTQCNIRNCKYNTEGWGY